MEKKNIIKKTIEKGKKSSKKWNGTIEMRNEKGKINFNFTFNLRLRIYIYS